MPFWNCHFPSNIKYSVFILYGVRGRGRGEAAATRFEKCQGKFCFQGKRKLLKILEWSKIFQNSEKFQGNSGFQRKRKLLKNPEWSKICIQYVHSRHTLSFRACASCSKTLNVKSIFNTVKIFRANISCSKNLNDKKYFNTVKNFRSNLFFRASASCSKILNDKKCIVNTVKNFRENSVFQGKC